MKKILLDTNGYVKYLTSGESPFNLLKKIRIAFGSEMTEN